MDIQLFDSPSPQWDEWARLLDCQDFSGTMASARQATASGAGWLGVVAMEDGRPVALLTVHHHRGLGVIWRAPWGHYETGTFEALLQAVAGVAWERLKLVLNPEWESPEMLERYGFRCAGAGWATLAVDTSCTPEELFATLPAGTRSKVRRALRRGVRVVEDPSRVDEFWEIYHEALAPRDREISLRGMRRLVSDRQASRLFVALAEGRPVAGTIVLLSPTGCESRYVASRSTLTNLYPSNALHWAAMHWANQSGLAVYDLGGYALDAKIGSKGERINRFKLSFGGRLLRFPIYVKERKNAR